MSCKKSIVYSQQSIDFDPLPLRGLPLRQGENRGCCSICEDWIVDNKLKIENYENIEVIKYLWNDGGVCCAVYHSGAGAL
jgi:hypothetical protein